MTSRREEVGMLNAMIWALDGVVPTSWVAAAKAAFSSGKTFATTGVMCSAMALPF